MSTLSPNLAAKIDDMSEDQQVRVVIFVRTPKELEQEGEQVPALSDRSFLRERLRGKQGPLLDELIDRLQQLEGDQSGPVEVKRHQLLGALTAPVSVSSLRLLATDHLIEKIVEDVETSLSSTADSSLS